MVIFILHICPQFCINSISLLVELSSSQEIGLIDGNVEGIEREDSSIHSFQSSLLEKGVPEGKNKKQKIQNKPPSDIHKFMQQTVTFNNTQEILSMNMSSTTSAPCPNSTPQLLLRTQPNDLPYSLPSTIVEPPIPSTIPLETATNPPIITEEEIPNPSTPNHPQNVTPRISSQHESLHFNNNQSLEVPTNSIPNSPAQVHPLNSTNEIIQESHVLIVENNSSPNVTS
ncbi:hypothetical protein O181_009302 [Austropuccinia psidii MF-1]|uniref:Uncharacterized protein n=1 Tax=Austropuccinia psidii MF-1 TaxID=1389203 RepID=A0A9Q3GK75_9BASI|nr:hypothetical protein [Austropuccinia psidii MF-1]